MDKQYVPLCQQTDSHKGQLSLVKVPLARQVGSSYPVSCANRGCYSNLIQLSVAKISLLPIPAKIPDVQ